jgi:Mrp family chromosome partitioning ATPase
VVDGLDLLPCGPLPANPVELLNNGFFAEVLDKLRERYDRIIIDSPPVMPVADARVIAALGDATILVLRAERSTRRISLAARNELWRVRATRIGVVVNGVPVRKQGHYGSGYGSGYGEYGYLSYGYGDEESAEDGRPSKRKAMLTKQVADAT